MNSLPIYFAYISFFLLILFSNNTFGQKEKNTTVTDTTVVKIHSPKKAALFSTFIPGLGQAYNKKYWKIPIIYTGFGLTGYFMSLNLSEYKRYRDAYKIRLDDDQYTIDEFEDKYSDESLIKIRDYYRRNVELMVIGSVAIYVFNIIDACVDAHLNDFKVTDDLSLRIDPFINYSICANTGITLTLKFK